MYRKTYAEVSLDHVLHNFNLIRESLGQGTWICPMVKANAYGHGDVTLALALERSQVQALGVCLIEEGLLLREMGVRAPILVFRGFDLEGAQEILARDLVPVVSDWGQLQILSEVATKKVKIHVKFDTGMNRLGFSLNEAQEILDFVLKQELLEVEGILTHLYCGEDAIYQEGHSTDQLRKFAKLKEIFSPLGCVFHALNSGATIAKILRQKNPHLNSDSVLAEDWGSRPGLMIYGYNPVSVLVENGLELKPAMSLKSFVNVFRSVPRGQGVSYGHSWRALRDSVLGIVPIGYADGVHRLLSNRAQVLFQGQRVPIVGKICMDYLMVDVTDFADRLNPEEKEITLFGYDSFGNFLSAEEQALRAETVAWEILTSVGERVPRIYRSEDPRLRDLL